ncbi:MAG: hypothetical protein R3236_08150 [Phycisphaeraceae bacterium]|nr:hypothetical protein [Phycisphaeraceae bacterium]
MPNRTDLLTTAAAAAMTVALTAGVFRTADLNAETDPNKITPRIAVPTLNVEGGTFTIRTDLERYDKTQEPVLTLKAHNPTDQAITRKIQVAITSMSANARVSRRLELPRSHWTHSQTVALKPGETKTIQLKTGIKLPTGRVVSVVMSDPNALMPNPITAQSLTRRNVSRRVAPNASPVSRARISGRRTATGDAVRTVQTKTPLPSPEK